MEESPEVDVPVVAVVTPPPRAHLFSTSMTAETSQVGDEQEYVVSTPSLNEQLHEVCRKGPQSQPGDHMISDPPRPPHRRQLAALCQLLQEGAQVDFINARTGETALHVACRSGSYWVVQHLIQHAGANVRHVDHQRRNALHKALAYHASFAGDQPSIYTVCRKPGAAVKSILQDLLEGGLHADDDAPAVEYSIHTIAAVSKSAIIFRPNNAHRCTRPHWRITKRSFGCWSTRAPTLTAWTPMIRRPYTWRVSKSLWIRP